MTRIIKRLSKSEAEASNEIAVKNYTVLLKPPPLSLSPSPSPSPSPRKRAVPLMIQLSPATADFSTRKIIRYFSCGRREGTPARGWSKRGEKNARLFRGSGIRRREYPGKCKTTFKQRKGGPACSTNERLRREPMDQAGLIHRGNKAR